MSRTMQQLREDSRHIFAAGVAAVDPVAAVQRAVVRQGNTPGYRFSLALTVLSELVTARASAQRGIDIGQLAARLRMPLMTASFISFPLTRRAISVRQR